MTGFLLLFEACSSSHLPPIYRVNLDLSRRTSARSSTHGRGDGLERISGIYEVYERNGIKARIIRRSDEKSVVYAYGHDEREAEQFAGKKVDVVGKVAYPQAGAPALKGNRKEKVRDKLPLPFFTEVRSIELDIFERSRP